MACQREFLPKVALEVDKGVVRHGLMNMPFQQEVFKRTILFPARRAGCAVARGIGENDLRTSNCGDA